MKKLIKKMYKKFNKQSCDFKNEKEIIIPLEKIGKVNYDIGMCFYSKKGLGPFIDRQSFFKKPEVTIEFVNNSIEIVVIRGYIENVLTQEEYYKNNILHGISKYFNKKGKLKRIVEYENGKKNSKIS